MVVSEKNGMGKGFEMERRWPGFLSFPSAGPSELGLPRIRTPFSIVVVGARSGFCAKLWRAAQHENATSFGEVGVLLDKNQPKSTRTFANE